MSDFAEKIDPNFYALITRIESMSEGDICWNICSVYKKFSEQGQALFADYYTKYPFWGRLDPANMVFETFYNRAKVLKEHCGDFVWLHEKLADARSKNVLYAILSNWMDFNFASLTEVKELTHPEYFDPIIFPPRADEVYVDAGAYIGSSVASFFNAYGTYKRIYCYEITPVVFEQLKNNLAPLNNIEFRLKAVGSENGKLYLSEGSHDSANVTSAQGETAIEVVSIDDDISEPVTFIKMDIEGAEKDALIGAKRQIRENHPRLAICTYHSYEDIVAIPRLIEEIAPGYKFYMRHHGGNSIPTEFTLLAVWD